MKTVDISINKTPAGFKVGCVGRYLQSFWFYVENDKFNVDSELQSTRMNSKNKDRKKSKQHGL